MSIESGDSVLTSRINLLYKRMNLPLSLEDNKINDFNSKNNKIYVKEGTFYKVSY